MGSLFDLTGRRAIVTGGTRGIGRAIAEGLHEMGAEVVIIGTNDTVFEAAKEIQGDGPNVYGVKGDVGERSTRQALFDECMAHLDGVIDILVNNAGVNIRNFTAIDYPYEDFDRMFAVNVEAVFYMCQMAAKLMIPRGYGKIINISSIAGLRGAKNMALYSATKAAVIHLTQSLSNEWAGLGLRVNSVAPGFTLTDLAKVSLQNPERMKQVYASLPVGHPANPEDMKGAVLFLASDASNHVTGVTIPVDGGSMPT